MTAREIAASELAEAERSLRSRHGWNAPRLARDVALVLGEYDRRGAVEQAAKVAAQAWEELPAGLVESLPDGLVTEMEALAVLVRTHGDGGQDR